MKRIFSVLIILAFVCMLPGCDSGKNIASGPAKSSSAVSSSPSLSASSSVDKDHFLGLTNRQMLEDYDYMWKTLDENYPYYGVAKRSGVDVQGVKTKYRAQMEKCNSDLQYYGILEKSLMTLQGKKYISLGHLYLPEAVDFQRWQDDYLSSNMRSIFTDQTTIKNYKKLLSVEKSYDSQAVKSVQNSFNAKEITTRILDENTAYVKIDSFFKTGQELESEGNTLYEFYKKISNKKNLIIDLSENEGGYADYWMNYIVAPNISKALSVKEYILLKKGANNLKYLPEDYGISPISKLPNLPKINHDDLKNLDAFATNDISVNPQTPGKKMFQGKIWVLVSNKTYSAAEAFSSFCKRTGFASIVGTRTGGDGVYKNSFLFFTLPNSHFVVRYGFEYGLNADGSCNQEYGTAPDVVPKAGQTPYDACMEAIRLKK